MDGGETQSEKPQEAGGWQYKPQVGPVPAVDPHTADPGPAQTAAGDSVEWTASEFIAHDKGAGWYGLLVLGTAVVATILYLITRDVFSTGAVVVLVAIFGVAAARKPRVLPYRVDGSGVTIGSRFHPYNEYKSFAMPEQEPFASVVLVPMKRFGFPLSIYLAPENEHQALEVLSNHLPLERGQLDSVDKLMRQLRF